MADIKIVKKTDTNNIRMRDGINMKPRNDINVMKPKLVPTFGMDLLSNPKKKISSDGEQSAPENRRASSVGDTDSDNDFDSDNDLRRVPKLTPQHLKSSDRRSYASKSEYESDSEEVESESGSEESGSEVSGSDEESESGSEVSGSDDSSVRSRPARVKSFEELQREKQEYLYRLERLEKQGYPTGKRFTMQSDYDEVKAEYEKVKRQRDTEKSIKFSRKMLMMFVSGVEFLNNKFDPFDIRLNGWSENVMENVTDYDEVFEELHDKYKEKVEMSPEIKLIMMVGGSAFMFHLTNTLLKSNMPSMGDILKENPELMKNFQQAAMNNMGNKMGDDPVFNMAQQYNNKTTAPSVPSASSMRSVAQESREMKGPSGVDDILSQLGKNSSETKPKKKNSIELPF